MAEKMAGIHQTSAHRLSKWLFLAPKFRASARKRKAGNRLALALNRAELEETGTHWVGDSIGEEPGVVADQNLFDPRYKLAPGQKLVRTLYAALIKDGIIYKVGDGCQLYNAANDDQPYIGRIIKLWEESVFHHKMALINWVYRPEDTRNGRQPTHGNYELFISNAEDINSVESFVGRAIFINYSEFVERYNDNDRTLKDVYFFRMKYDDLRNQFTPAQLKSVGKQSHLPSNRKLNETPKTSKKRKQQGSAPSTPSRKKRARQDEDIEDHEPWRDAGEIVDSNDADYQDENILEGVEDQAQKKRRQRSRRSVAASKDSPAKRKLKWQPSGLPMRGVLLPTRSLPLLTISADVFEQTKARLHVSVVPDSLPCRENEFDEIKRSIEGAIEQGTGTCLYISGVPGTGKTATVLEVMRHLRANSEAGVLPPFDFVELNGMRLTDPSNAYSVLWEALTGKHITPAHAAQSLEKYFSTPSPRRHSCVVLMDELDLLITRKQDVIYNLFDWPNRKHARLIVVAVANTMDMPERMLSSRVSSRLGLARITFEPYTHQQLMKIVTSRLTGLQTFDENAIEFCARKVAAVSGDARRTLDICRRAVELADRQQQQQESSTNVSRLVMMEHISAALSEMLASSAVKAVRQCALQEKIFLCALLAVIRATGVTEVSFGEAARRHQQLCRLHSHMVPNMSNLASVCSRLGSHRVLLVQSPREDLMQRIRFNVTEDDIIFSLRNDNSVQGLVPN